MPTYRVKYSRAAIPDVSFISLVEAQTPEAASAAVESLNLLNVVESTTEEQQVQPVVVNVPDIPVTVNVPAQQPPSVSFTPPGQSKKEKRSERAYELSRTLIKQELDKYRVEEKNRAVTDEQIDELVEVAERVALRFEQWEELKE